MDDQCKQSCVVYVDDVYSPRLSRTSSIPADVIAGSILSLCADSGDNSESRRQLMEHVTSAIEHIPDSKELPRNSFGSDVLTVLNLVSLFVWFVVWI